MDHGWLGLWNCAKAKLVRGRSDLSLAVCALSTSKITQERPMVISPPFLSLLSPSPPLLSLSRCSVQLCSPLLFSPFLWQEILTIAGQSFPSEQEAAGPGLTGSECSDPVGVRQQLANKAICSPPQRLSYIHGKPEVKSLNTIITEAGSLKWSD